MVDFRPIEPQTKSVVFKSAQGEPQSYTDAIIQYGKNLVKQQQNGLTTSTTEYIDIDQNGDKKADIGLWYSNGKMTDIMIYDKSGTNFVEKTFTAGDPKFSKINTSGTVVRDIYVQSIYNSNDQLVAETYRSDNYVTKIHKGFDKKLMYDAEGKLNEIQADYSGDGKPYEIVEP